MSPEIENVAEFLKAALRDGPRRVTDVLHDACIYQIPVEVLIQGLDALDIRWQKDQAGLECWAMP